MKELARAMFAIFAVLAVVSLLTLLVPVECDSDAECAEVHGEPPPAPMDWTRGADRSAP